MRRTILIMITVFLAGFFIVKSVNKPVEQLSLWDEYYSQKKELKKSKSGSNKAARIEQLKEYFSGIKTPYGSTESGYPVNYLYDEYNKAKQNSSSFKSSSNIEWISRGPANVGGRTRGLLYDPDDATFSTWYAGSATGGVWKTVDAGKNWECITSEIPYMATTTLAMPKTNSNVIYVGTGESFPGSMQTVGGGIFVSENDGINWTHVASTATNEDFRYVNRIIIHPTHDDTIFVATTEGVMRSFDKGVSWTKIYSDGNVEDLVEDNVDFNNLYASVNGVGVIRTQDMGATWDTVNAGFVGGLTRIELATSPTSSGIVFASLNRVDDSSYLYYTNDFGTTWQKVAENFPVAYDYLGGQGDYDNTLAVNPYNENEVFWGGVNLWKATITANTGDGGAGMKSFYGVNTESFLDFTNFTGSGLPGINTGQNEGAIGITTADFVNVELRFGPGLSQKAHRFTVPDGATSGVPASDYTYQNYVDVPFQVWDVDNNKQLMCSFRDQENDGAFNLYETTGSDWGQQGREYLFVHAVDYDDTNPHASIAVVGGRSYKMLYFMWPTLAEGGTWDAANLPSSKQVIEYIAILNRISDIENVSDAYEAYGGNNSYRQGEGFGQTEIPGLHPDHHELLMIPVNDQTKEYWILNGNDGGLGLSKDKGVSFVQFKTNYITTQFYGVAKKPYANEYIGGMQDNGTWQSPINEDAGTVKGYRFRLGGDGFETIWHSADSNKIMGTLYNNAIYVSEDHGLSWTPSKAGISDGDGPFITRLSNLTTNPDMVFAVGSSGLYTNDGFGTSIWRKKTLTSEWLGLYSKVTSSHNVKVSLANDSIIWAGAGMSTENEMRLFVSQDQGKTFSTVSLPGVDMPYRISGMATHPTNRKVCYALYSGYSKPKILRTDDLGNTWTDISGFNTNPVSDNGFPNVGCLSLFVFPDDTNRIWAGTEIGIFESIDNGVSWDILDSELPTAPVWQIFMQDNQVVVATYGRGIWTYQYAEAPQRPVSVEERYKESGFSFYPNPVVDELYIKLNNDQSGDYDISVYDMKGGLVLTGRKYLSSGDRNVINVSNLQVGIYLLKIDNSAGNVITKRIIKQ